MVKIKNIFTSVSNTIKNTDKKILKIIKKGFILSSFLILIAIIILLVHNYFFISFDLIDVAIILFKTNLFFAMQFILCGFAFDQILKLQ